MINLDAAGAPAASHDDCNYGLIQSSLQPVLFSLSLSLVFSLLFVLAVT
jgi:hypothetical protein